GSLLWQAVRSGTSIPSDPLIPRAYATAPGAIDSVPLPGGGYAILGPRSRLTIDLGYGRQTRDVTLEGEALFEVPHDESRPFTVHAGAALVRDIGTTFTVRSDEEGVKVVVISGSVLLRDTIGAAPRTATLGAGDMARLGRQEPVNVRRGIRTDEQTAWTRKRLVFDDATLAQVKDDLRRWYGIELVLADSGLASRHVRASFAGEPPDQVLKVIGLALGASIERRGDTAVVRLRKGGSGPP
ncbi:MAG: DUF4974 domain-containing protein, partial [Gemmatimonadales bacterium]|nr:DUF4974 domain-containing protein [Gemmatimonadales bacterium]